MLLDTVRTGAACLLSILVKELAAELKSLPVIDKFIGNLTVPM